MLDYYVCMQWPHDKKWVQLDKDSPAIPLPVIHLVAGPYDLTTALTVKREHDEVHRQGSCVDRDLHHTFFGKENHSTLTDTGAYAVHSAQDLCTKALNRKIAIDYYRRLPEYKVSFCFYKILALMLISFKAYGLAYLHNHFLESYSTLPASLVIFPYKLVAERENTWTLGKASFLRIHSRQVITLPNPSLNLNCL